MQRHQVQVATVAHVENVAIVDITYAEDERHRRVGEHTLLLLHVPVEARLHGEFVGLHGIISSEEGDFLRRRHL